ncbi:MAG: TIGR01777 family oxidoreductase [Prolixibacteraceae bacterium]|nr:TIGR01777 family oxidoreductase [Prolixibacteraceae bacterium]
MKIAISGANGYIAKNLIVKLKSAGHEIFNISRTTLYNKQLLLEELVDIDVVIHLAGAPILQKWTEKNKIEILRSRTESTDNIVQVINELPLEKRPHSFISASAVGIYTSNSHHTEYSTNFADDFVGQVVKSWEKSSDQLNKSVRKVIFRIGVVLGKESQTIQNLLPVFKFGLGGKIGSGQQPFPFVHIDDVTSAIFWAIHNSEVHGIYNLVNPENITNLQLTSELSKILHRPNLFTVPEFALKLIYGEAASLLLQAPFVFPERLLKYGFRFKYPDLKSSLAEIIA